MKMHGSSSVRLNYGIIIYKIKKAQNYKEEQNKKINIH